MSGQILSRNLSQVTGQKGLLHSRRRDYQMHTNNNNNNTHNAFRDRMYPVRRSIEVHASVSGCENESRPAYDNHFLRISITNNRLTVWTSREHQHVAAGP